MQFLHPAATSHALLFLLLQHQIHLNRTSVLCLPPRTTPDLPLHILIRFIISQHEVGLLRGHTWVLNSYRFNPAPHSSIETPSVKHSCCESGCRADLMEGDWYDVRVR